MANLLAAPWLTAYQRLDGDDHYELFSWAELTPSERTDLLERRQQKEFPTSLDPLQMEPLQGWNSMGLRYNGRVVGWMITHHNNDKIQYTSLYLDSQNQQKKLGVALLSAAVHKQILESEYAIGICQIAPENRPMLLFKDHYFQPYIVKQSEKRVSFRQLSRTD